MALKLYSRPGCHLCDLLFDELAAVLPAGTPIEIVDISEDADLMRRYGLRIPVLCGDDTEISGYPLNSEKLSEFLVTRDR